MKRIIYKKINEYTYETKCPIDIDSGGKVMVIYNLEAKTWSIINFKTNECLARGEGTSKHKILIKIKNALKSLGAKFNIEKRYKDIEL